MAARAELSNNTAAAWVDTWHLTPYTSAQAPATGY
jgi:hypothetical protein